MHRFGKKLANRSHSVQCTRASWGLGNVWRLGEDSSWKQSLHHNTTNHFTQSAHCPWPSPDHESCEFCPQSPITKPRVQPATWIRAPANLRPVDQSGTLLLNWGISQDREKQSRSCCMTVELLHIMRMTLAIGHLSSCISIFRNKVRFLREVGGWRWPFNRSFWPRPSWHWEGRSWASYLTTGHR